MAHFFHFRAFGFYEDDYAHLSPAIGWRVSDLVNYAAQVFVTWPQGRPLNFLLPPLFFFIGSHLGGLHVAYLIAFVIETVNAWLFYVLLKRVSTDTIALTGALAFCLFPADTTHSFLVHAFHLQTSLTVLLIASLCYLSGQRLLSYLIAPASLMAYESPFMVFLAVPLLKHTWDRALAKELVRHIAILSGILIVVLVIRASVGEERVTDMGSSLSIVIARIGAAVLIGPPVSLSLFGYGPIRTLFHWQWPLTLVFVAALVLFIWALGRMSDTSQPPPVHPEVARLMLAGIVMLCLAYVASFTHFPPIARYGRATSVHLAAAFGASLIFGCVSSLFLAVAAAHRLKKQGVVALALYLSLVVAYGFSIQLDFKQAWSNQRAFWTGAIGNLPDMMDETIVFVIDEGLPRTRYIFTNSWADPTMLRQMFQFPAQWKNPPRLFVVHRDWPERVVDHGTQFKWKVPTATWWSHWETLPNANVILLEMERGRLVRKSGHIDVHGRSFDLKPMPRDASLNLRKGPLYDYVIIETGRR